MRTSIRVVAVLALVLAACGGGDAVDEPTTTTTQPTTTTTQPTTTTTEPAPGVPATVYFLSDDGGSDTRPGPFLIAVHREVGDEVEPEIAALRALFAGPTEAERAAGISSAMPDATDILGISIDEGTATVDLTVDFERGGGSLAMFARLAQLTGTLTAFEGIDAVVLALDGTPVEVFGGEGIIIDEPMTLMGFQDLLPGILVRSPAYGAPIEDPVVVEGVAAAFEGVFQLQVLDAAGAVLAEPDFVQTDDGVGWGSFSVELDLDVEAPADLVIRVWEFSARDGSVVSERLVPVHLEG